MFASDVWISVTVSVLSNIYLEHLHKNGYIIWTVVHGLKEALTAKPCDICRKQFVKIYKHLRKAFLGVHIGDYKPCIIVYKLVSLNNNGFFDKLLLLYN